MSVLVCSGFDQYREVKPKEKAVAVNQTSAR